MKLRYVLIPVFILFTGFLIFFYMQMPPEHQQQAIAIVEELLPQTQPAGHNVMAVSKSQEKSHGQIKEAESKLTNATEMQLKSIWEQVSELSLFDTREIEPFREQLLKIGREEPDTLAEFVVQQVLQAENNKTEPSIVFIEAFIGSHNSPGKMVSEILKVKEPEVQDSSQSSKTNILKAFVLESLFERYSQGPDFLENPLPVIEVDLVRAVKNSKDLNLVRESLLLLRENYNYSVDQLKILVYSRPQQDSFAFEDLLR